VSRISSLYVALALVLAPSIGAAESMETLIARCAPGVDVETLGAIVRAESSGHVFVLSDDGPRHLPWSRRKHMLRSIYPATAEEAASEARRLIAAGHLVGIGLTQISSQHLPGLPVTIEQLLDPCTNLATGAGMLRTLYQKARATARYADPQHALGAAISAYNTGNFSDGFTNGYVHKVLANMKAGMPKLSSRALPTRGMRHTAAPAQLVASAAPRAAHATARESSLDVVFQ
jgi:type IV secretion system protein VirB1